MKRIARLVGLLLALSWSASAQTVPADRFVLKSGPCTLRSGSGAPSGGNNCDQYVDYSSGFSYEKIGGAWVLRPALMSNNIFTGSLTAPTIYGSSAANGDITIEGTSDATKATSYVILQPTSGYVGIGTAGPTSPLTVKGAIRVIKNSNAAFVFEDRTNAGVQWTLYSDASSFRFYKGGDKVVIDTNGNVGIGTAAPLTPLEVQAGLTTTGAVLTLSSKETSTVADDILGRINFRAALDASGTDAILTGASIAAIAENTFSASVNETGLQFSTGASEAAVERMRIDHHGNLGIGTTLPLAKLSVSEAAATTSISQSNTAASSIANVTQFYQTALSSSGERTMFNLVSSFSDVTDATRTSLVKFNTMNAGTVGTPLAILGGNVGVGTIAPLSKLSINGGLHVGGDSDAGDNNALIDGTLDVTGLPTFPRGLGSVPAIVAVGRQTGQTAAVASVATYTVGATDGSFEVSAEAFVNSGSSYDFIVTVAYTDKGGNAHTLTLPFTKLDGSIVTDIVNAGGSVPYSSPVLHIRCKASTAITVATSGNFTLVGYDVESTIKQIG